MSRSVTVAALYVDPRGSYAGVRGIDMWPESRDARRYAGPHPIVAHPPCSRWCQMAHAIEARYGYRVGDDGGCFESALECVRIWGGVIEHPAYTRAWAAYGLDRPAKERWTRDRSGGWVCQVDQSRYGCLARKRTWLYVFGTVDPPPDLLWGPSPREEITHMVSFCKNHTNDKRPRLSKRQASATPPLFRDVLIGLAILAGERHE